MSPADAYAAGSMKFTLLRRYGETGTGASSLCKGDGS